MGTPTYSLISEQVLGSASATVTFSSIPQTYKDLVLEIVTAGTVASQDAVMRVNGDTGSNYSFTRLSGNGSTATSGRMSGTAFMYLDYLVGMPTNLSSGYVALTHILSYSNPSVYKTVITRSGYAGGDVEALVNLWRSTAAITSLLVYPTSGSFVADSTFRLWGVLG